MEKYKMKIEHIKTVSTEMETMNAVQKIVCKIFRIKADKKYSFEVWIKPDEDYFALYDMFYSDLTNEMFVITEMCDGFFKAKITRYQTNPPRIGHFIDYYGNAYGNAY
jgi:hypothetical protein